MRLSKASERERLELEEAMRLSLAESEAQTANAQQNDGFDNPVFEGNEDHDSSGPSSRRISSYTPASQLEGNHRRAASDTYSRDPRPNIENTTSGMNHLTIPDTWQSGGSSSGPNNLMDDDFGSTDYQQPALAPQRTGAVLQSKNPFLSPGEREAPSASSGFIQPHASPSYGFTQQHAPEGSPNEKRLPTIPGSQAASPTMYEPPPGPPPPLSNPTSPPSHNPSYLPPLPPRQPTFPVDGSPNNSPQGRRLPPRPQQPPTLPQRNVSASMYSASNLPTSSFPSHSPNPPTPSFFPPQPSPGLSPSPGQSADLQRTISTHHGGEDPLETLRDFHTVFMGKRHALSND
jgi:hypothetical protein